MKARTILVIMLCLLLMFNITGCTKKTYNRITEKAPFPTEEWTRAYPEELGMSSEMLDKADKRIKKAYPNIESMLVVKEGYLVYEKYYKLNNETKIKDTYSVTKSIMSALTGIAIEKGLISSIDDKVAEYIPEFSEYIDDERKKDITIKQVLTMTGGLESIDNNYTSFFYSDDWLKAALAKPLVNSPGEVFVYNTGLTQLLSSVIANVSGMSVMDFAKENLFEKIGMNVTYWQSDKQGSNGGGSGLCLTSQDMARFGYLYLNNGLWDNEQVIPAEWIEDSLKSHIKANDTQDYGYLFWIEKISDTVNSKTYSIFQAYGSGGQIIMVIPELDMVIVITCDRSISPTVKPMTRAIITDYILPSAYME